MSEISLKQSCRLSRLQIPGFSVKMMTGFLLRSTTYELKITKDLMDDVMDVKEAGNARKTQIVVRLCLFVITASIQADVAFSR